MPITWRRIRLHFLNYSRLYWAIALFPAGVAFAEWTQHTYAYVLVIVYGVWIVSHWHYKTILNDLQLVLSRIECTYAISDEMSKVVGTDLIYRAQIGDIEELIRRNRELSSAISKLRRQVEKTGRNQEELKRYLDNESLRRDIKRDKAL